MRKLAILLLALMVQSVAMAAPIEFLNASFESPTLTDGTQTAAIPFWTVVNGNWATRNTAAGEVVQTNSPGVYSIANKVSTDGSNVLVGTAVGAIYTTLHGYTLAPGQTWSFTLDVAATHAPQNTVIGFHLTTADNLGTFVPAATGGAGLLNPVSANFNGWYSPTFSATTPNNASFLNNFDGKTPVLQIILAYWDGSPPGYPLYIDNIRGTTTATFDPSLLPTVPEPSSLALLSISAVALLARRRHR